MKDHEIQLNRAEAWFARRLAKEYMASFPLYVVCTYLRAAGASPIHPRYAQGEGKFDCCLRLARHDVATAWKKLPLRKLA